MNISIKRKVFAGIIFGFILIATFFWLYSISKSNVKPRVAATVTVVPVQQQNLTIFSNAIGSAQAHASVALKSKVEGELLKVGFKEGDTVQAGQSLFAIDSRVYAAKLQEANANLVRDQAQLTFAKQSLGRNIQLAKQGYISKQDYEKLQSNQASLVATVQADQAAVVEAQLNVSNCAITAPISGKTGAVAVTAGNLVKANDQNPLVTINQIAPIDVKFSIPEKQFSQLKNLMQQGKITIQASLEQAPNIIKTGILAFADNTVDATTGTIQLKATFDNVDQYFWPGQFVKIILPMDQLKNALVVPTRAVQMGQNGAFVFVVQNEIAKVRPVTLGANINDNTVVVSGLQPNEFVVIDGQLYLADGAKVRVNRQK